MLDIFLVSECKLDLSFPESQIANYNIFRKDRNKNGGGLLFYVNQDLNCKIVNTENFPTDMKILILGLYKTPSLTSEIFISEVT